MVNPASALRFHVISFFAVLRNIQALYFVFFGDANSGDGVDNLQNYDGADESKHPRKEHSNQLITHLCPAAIEPADRFAFTENGIEYGLCEHTGK